MGKLVNLQDLVLDFNQLKGPIPLSLANLKALRKFRFFMNPGLCAGADRVIRNWLRGIGEVLGPDCSPSISLSVAPSSLVEGGGPTRVMVTATRTPVGNRTSVNLLIGGTAALGESQDYTLSGFRGTFIAIVNALTIPAGIGPAGRHFVGALFATPAEGDMSGIVIGARTGSPDARIQPLLQRGSLWSGFG